MTRSEIVTRIGRNGISKRYIAKRAEPGEYFRKIGVYDQRDRRFIPDDEIERIDPDERLTLR